MKYNNTMIKVLSYEHGQRVKKWWDDQGIITKGYVFDAIEQYYGLVDNTFVLKNHLPAYAKEIKLPKDVYPKLMWVKDIIDNDWYKRVVFMEKNGKYLAWVNAENIQDCKEILTVRVWECAKDIEEETTIELTLDDISNGKGVGVPPHLIRIKK